MFFYPEVPLCDVQAITVDNGDVYATGVISLDGVLFQSFAVKITGGTTLAWTTEVPLLPSSFDGIGLAFFPDLACLTILDRQRIPDEWLFVLTTFNKDTGAITSSVSFSQSDSNFLDLVGAPGGPAYLGFELSVRRVLCQT